MRVFVLHERIYVAIRNGGRHGHKGQPYKERSVQTFLIRIFEFRPLSS